MTNLITAIMTKVSGSALSTAVGGRVYFDEAPQGCAFPYVVFFIVSGSPDPTFTDGIDDILIQFSIFSTSKSITEISGIYGNMKTLFDDCALTITGATHLWMERRNLSTMTDEITTTAGTVGIKHWAVDYSIMVKA